MSPDYKIQLRGIILCDSTHFTGSRAIRVSSLLWQPPVTVALLPRTCLEFQAPAVSSKPSSMNEAYGVRGPSDKRRRLIAEKRTLINLDWLRLCKWAYVSGRLSWDRKFAASIGRANVRL